MRATVVRHRECEWGLSSEACVCFVHTVFLRFIVCVRARLCVCFVHLSYLRAQRAKFLMAVTAEEEEVVVADDDVGVAGFAAFVT